VKTLRAKWSLLCRTIPCIIIEQMHSNANRNSGHWLLSCVLCRPVCANKSIIIYHHCVQTEADNKQLRAQLAQLKTTQAQNKVCINQLLSRLHEVETVRRSEQSTIEVLQQQVNTYREDFEGEQLDRHRAQERVVNLERQVATLKNRVRVRCIFRSHSV